MDDNDTYGDACEVCGGPPFPHCCGCCADGSSEFPDCVCD